jgi:hypothetical protein
MNMYDYMQKYIVDLELIKDYMCYMYTYNLVFIICIILHNENLIIV